MEVTYSDAQVDLTNDVKKKKKKHISRKVYLVGCLNTEASLFWLRVKHRTLHFLTL